MEYDHIKLSVVILFCEYLNCPRSDVDNLPIFTNPGTWRPHWIESTLLFARPYD